MGQKTSIAWTDATWNPWRGCHKVSAGCENCYWHREAKRYGHNPNVVVRSKTTFNDPLRWREPRKIFVCSWSDFFIEEATPWRMDAWRIIEQTPQHTYQILTKRVEQMYNWFIDLDVWGWENRGVPFYVPLKNVWVGVTAENQNTLLERVAHLQQIPAVVRFLSIEPMLEEIDLDVALVSVDCGDEDRGYDWVEPVDWVIIGGESGPNARPFDPNWARSVIRQCHDVEVPVFVKQLGSNPVGLELRHRHGADPSEWPEDLRVQEFPAHG